VNGRRPLTATPAPKREIRFAPLSWKAPHLPPRLEGVAESVPLALTVACSRIRSGPVSPSLRRQAYGRGCWAFHPQGDKATVVRVLSLSGEILGSRRRLFQRWAPRFRLATPPPGRLRA
jgi:hypothetical protein